MQQQCLISKFKYGGGAIIKQQCYNRNQNAQIKKAPPFENSFSKRGIIESFI